MSTPTRAAEDFARDCVRQGRPVDPDTVRQLLDELVRLRGRQRPDLRRPVATHYDRGQAGRHRRGSGKG